MPQTLEYLDKIPDLIYRRLVTHQYRPKKNPSQRVTDSERNLELRCLGILKIRDCLLMGHRVLLSDLELWLDSQSAQRLHPMLTDKNMTQQSQGNPLFVDHVILNLLDWLDHTEQNPAETIGSWRQENATTETAPSNFSDQGDQTNHARGLIDSQAEKNVQLMQPLNRRFALQRELGWDLSRGIGSESDIRQLLALHKQIKSSRQLQSIIRMIGRHKPQAAEPLSQTTQDFSPGPKGIQRRLPDDYAISRVSGVYYGDELSRMLPSQLMMLGHRKLKMLWHARRSEQQLLNYHFQGVIPEHETELQSLGLHDHAKARQRLRQQGPIILCVDTSASMKGKAEQLARAIALETMGVAHIEKRPCYLFCFSGAGEISELELNLERGWQPLLEFINYSFRGGTDINPVLQKALDRLQRARWQNADILLLSDGRFRVEQAVKDAFKSLRPAVRIYGIQLGNWKTSALGDICHRVFSLNYA